jgi:hypothetical protein
MKMSNSSREGKASQRRTHLQWLLAQIGLKVGCQVWIAGRDHEKVWKNDLLGSLSLPSLPQLQDSAFQPLIGQIAVLWLLKNDIVAAYEIETTTDISASFLRLYDLGVLCSKRQVHLCMVTSKKSLEQMQFELSRPIFRRSDLRKRCTLMCEELLLQHAEHILRWATSPSVIHDIIDNLSDGAQR